MEKRESTCHSAKTLTPLQVCFINIYFDFSITFSVLKIVFVLGGKRKKT